jgi:hypothetical protein
MSNDIDHTIALQALGWEPLKSMREKAKAKLMYKFFNKMGPQSLTNFFTYKGGMTNYGTFPVVFVYHNLEQIT